MTLEDSILNGYTLMWLGSWTLTFIGIGIYTSAKNRKTRKEKRELYSVMEDIPENNRESIRNNYNN